MNINKLLFALLVSLVSCILTSTLGSFAFQSVILDRKPNHKPGYQLVGHYKQHNNLSISGHVVSVVFDTTIPSLNPDQTGAVSAVQCDGAASKGTITLYISDPIFLEKVSDWPRKILILISHKWLCFGKSKTQFFLVTNYAVDTTDNKVIMNAESCDVKEWANTMSIDTTWLQAPPNWTQSQTRRLGKRQSIDFPDTLSLNVNYDPLTGKPIVPKDIIISSPDGITQSLTCSNCFTKGEATIKFHADYTLTPLKLIDATVTLDGNFELSIEITESGGLKATIPTPDQQLNKIGLPILDIPGTFNLDPCIILDVSTDIPLSFTGSIKAGVTVSLPNFHLEVSLLDQKINQFGWQPQIEPQVTNHDGFTSDADISVTFKTRLELDMDVLNGLWKQNAGLQIVYTFTMGVRVDPETNCKGNSLFDAKLIGDMNFFVDNTIVIPFFSNTLPVASICLYK